ncbi:UNVERIFIED_CONTAM: hypothetical protein FKN15_018421 [Acipenser sinensis]
MGHQQLYWSHPRKYGQGSRSCRVCSNRHGLIRKYGLNMCRQCFRQYAKDIGFVKVREILEEKIDTLFCRGFCSVLSAVWVARMVQSDTNSFRNVNLLFKMAVMTNLT